MPSVLKTLEAELNPPKPALPADTQQVCIDLPGEDIHCYIYKEKLQIMLRKHRDVIFDIALFKGTTYTVEADQSDLYNARDKKIVEVRRKQKVSFADGERLHLHVGREFKGSLILRANDRVLARYEPNRLDKTTYGEDPAVKPAPFMVVMHNPKAAQPMAAKGPVVQALALQCTPDNPLGLSGPLTNISALLAQPNWSDPLQATLPSRGEDQTMHIVEVLDRNNAPPQVLKFFMEGGDESAIDGDSIVSRNWILSQMFGAQAHLIDSRAWAKELMGTEFRLQRVVHKSGPKVYIVFKGRPGLRKLMSASRYAITNTKVVKITAGAGSPGQAWGAAKSAATDSVKVFAEEGGKTVFKAGGIAVLFTIAMDTAEWYQDYSQIGPDGKPKKDFTDLFVKIGVDLLKVGLSAAIASIVVAAALTMAIGLVISSALAVTAIVIGTLAVAVIVGYLLDLADKNTGRALGEEDIASWLSKKLKFLGAELHSKFSKESLYNNYENLFKPSQEIFSLGAP
jgi:hypothetical protein